MADPLILSYGKGYLPGFYVNPEAVIDPIPIDMVVNASIAAMAKYGIARKSGITVHHVASSAVNPLLFRGFFDFSYEHFVSSPFIDSKGKAVDIMKMKFFSSIDDFSSFLWKEIFQQCLLMDSTISNNSMSQRLERKCKRIVEYDIKLAKIYEPYMFSTGRFDNANTHKVMEAMSEEEKQRFQFDVESIDWEDFLVNIHIPGLRKHVLKGRGMPN